MIRLFTFLTFICIWGSLSAQSGYELTVSQQPYQELTQPRYFSASDSVDGGYYLTRNMDFPVFNTKAGFKLNMNPPSRGAWISPQGYMAVYEVPSYGSTVVFQALLSNMQHSSNSSVTWQYEGMAGSGILKIQWKNFGIKDEPDGFINLQLWLDEANKTVSYHYGPNKVELASNKSTFSGIFTMANDFSKFFKDFRIQGNPMEPAIGTATNFNSMTTMPLNGIPTANTVYTIAFTSSSGIAETNTAAQVSIYPNPVKDQLFIASDVMVKKAVVYDLCGKMIAVELVRGENPYLDVSSLQSGSYILQIETENAATRQLFIKD